MPLHVSTRSHSTHQHSPHNSVPSPRFFWYANLLDRPRSTADYRNVWHPSRNSGQYVLFWAFHGPWTSSQHNHHRSGVWEVLFPKWVHDTANDVFRSGFVFRLITPHQYGRRFLLLHQTKIGPGGGSGRYCCTYIRIPHWADSAKYIELAHQVYLPPGGFLLSIFSTSPHNSWPSNYLLLGLLLCPTRQKFLYLLVCLWISSRTFKHTWVSTKLLLGGLNHDAWKLRGAILVKIAITASVAFGVIVWD